MKKNIRTLAQDIINFKIGIIEGSRKIFYELCNLGLQNEKDFLIFTGVASESEEFPIGEQKKNWDENALKKKEKSIREFEKFYQKEVLKGCQKIIDKFGDFKV